MLLITIRHSKCECEYTLTFEFVPDCHKTPEMCKIIVSKDSFMLKYCAYISTTQKINENALDVYILTPKFVSEWFVTHKKLTNLNYCLLFNDFNMIMATLMIILLLTLMITLIILKFLSIFHGSINTINVKKMKTRQTKNIKRDR